MNITTKKSNAPLRRCIVSGERLEKKQLLRLVRTPRGDLVIDLTGKLNGRGAYIKRDLTIIDRLQASTLLKRHLDVDADPAFYDTIREVLRG
jgi:uncharacterized protein